MLCVNGVPFFLFSFFFFLFLFIVFVLQLHGVVSIIFVVFFHRNDAVHLAHVEACTFWLSNFHFYATITVVTIVIAVVEIIPIRSLE